VGVAGGALGVLLSLGGLAVVNKWGQTLAQRNDLFHFDGTMLLAAVGLSLLAGLIAGAYPAWRICRTAPAIHLKLQ
jgi:putative ABC transport system permease protein